MPSNNVTICVKCVGKHASYNCEKTRDTPARCCNCGLDHPASSTQYKVYLDLLEERRNRQQNGVEARRKPIYKPARARNVWETSARQRQADSVPQSPRNTEPSHNLRDNAPPLTVSRPHARNFLRYPRRVKTAPALYTVANCVVAERWPCS
ncbi:hypothetical protein Trydic_g23157 [Trypoxylus dichotomus]